mmetsp:Transcript_32516/g.81506  ORF Transcript_32516/g.81506 Transcript_32516/m.81506 type:complete len:250 (+) Transcript_32516:299-1048(+)
MEQQSPTRTRTNSWKAPSQTSSCQVAGLSRSRVEAEEPWRSRSTPPEPAAGMRREQALRWSSSPGQTQRDDCLGVSRQPTTVPRDRQNDEWAGGGRRGCSRCSKEGRREYPNNALEAGRWERDQVEGQRRRSERMAEGQTERHCWGVLHQGSVLGGVRSGSTAVPSCSCPSVVPSCNCPMTVVPMQMSSCPTVAQKGTGEVIHPRSTEEVVHPKSTVKEAHQRNRCWLEVMQMDIASRDDVALTQGTPQ